MKGKRSGCPHGSDSPQTQPLAELNGDDDEHEEETSRDDFEYAARRVRGTEMIVHEPPPRQVNRLSVYI